MSNGGHMNQPNPQSSADKAPCTLCGKPVAVRGYDEHVRECDGRADKTPIHEGDRFRSGKTVYIVTEVGRFGAPNWVVTEDRRAQRLFHHRELRTMTRLPSASSPDGAK